MSKQRSRSAPLALSPRMAEDSTPSFPPLVTPQTVGISHIGKLLSRGNTTVFSEDVFEEHYSVGDSAWEPVSFQDLVVVEQVEGHYLEVVRNAKTEEMYLLREYTIPQGSFTPEIHTKMIARFSYDVPQILHAKEVYVSNKKGRVCVLMEHTKLQTVASRVRRLGPFSARSVRMLTSSLLRVVMKMHQQAAFHLNLNPCTVYFDEITGAVRVDVPSFLDDALPLSLSETGQLALSQLYAAPEQLVHGAAGAETDIWGIGMVAAYAFLGRHPFQTEGLSTVDIVLRTTARQAKISWNDAKVARVPTRLREVVAKCLQCDMRSRWRVGELSEQEFVKGEDDNALTRLWVPVGEGSLNDSMIGNQNCSAQRNNFGEIDNSAWNSSSDLEEVGVNNNDNNNTVTNDSEISPAARSHEESTQWAVLCPKLLHQHFSGFRTPHYHKILQCALDYVMITAPLVTFDEYVHERYPDLYAEGKAHLSLCATVRTLQERLNPIVLECKEGEFITFGRGAHCLHRFADPCVSTEQFVLFRYPNDVVVLDNRSRHHTLVNGTPITTRVQLHAGDVIEFGTKGFGFVLAISESMRQRATLQQPSSVAPRGIMNWTKGECIGEGTSAKVFLGMDVNTGALLAAKEFNTQRMTTEDIGRVMQEVVMLQGLHHEHIVAYLGSERTEDTLYLFLEYVPGGTVASLVRKFGRIPLRVVRLYTLQLLLGLDYMHSCNVVHGDIKGANVLVTDTGKVKLGDFGGATKLAHYCDHHHGSSCHSTEFCDGVGLDDEYCRVNHLGKYRTSTTELETVPVVGTPLYMSPETIRNNTPSLPGDVWGLACTILEMLGFQPWREANFSSVPTAVYHIASCGKGPQLPTVEELGLADRRVEAMPLLDFLSQAFVLDPNLRPGVAELLTHEFVTQPGAAQAQEVHATSSSSEEGSPVPPCPRGAQKIAFQKPKNM